LLSPPLGLTDKPLDPANAAASFLADIAANFIIRELGALAQSHGTMDESMARAVNGSLTQASG
jgi:hypothetical protein